MTRRAAILSTALVLLAGPVVAQAGEDYDRAILEACLAGQSTVAAWDECIGVGAAACLNTEAGTSTVGVGYCYHSEWEHWDTYLNAVYQQLLVEQAALDEDTLAYNPNLPSAVETMRAMQRLWIQFRDAACEWEWTQWGGGTGGGPASAACMMDLTAQQTIFLQQRVAQ